MASARGGSKPPSLGSLPERPGFEVGYGRPPVHSRFRKGVSGNPKGRPKGAKNKPAAALPIERLKDIVLEEAYRTISVRDGLRDVKVPMAQAVIRSLAVNAVKGHQRAQRLFAELVMATERDRQRLKDDWLDTAYTYKTKWDQELERRRTHGIVAPDPLPHPDSVKIDWRTGQVQILGPLTKDEAAALETWREHRATLELEVGRLERQMRRGRGPLSRQEFEEEIRQHKLAISVIDTMQETGRPLLPLPEV